MTSAIFGLQLLTSDLDKVVPFYERLFGWHLEKHAMGFYHFTFPQAPQATTGGTLMQHPLFGMPSAWVTYVDVPDITTLIAQVVPAGGGIIQLPLPSPLGGLFAVISDPTGAVLGLFQRIPS